MREYALKNIHLHLLLPVYDDELVKLVKGNNVAFAEAVEEYERTSCGRVRHPELVTALRYTSGLADVDETSPLDDDLRRLEEREQSLETIKRWGIATGLLLMRLAQMSRSSNLLESHLSLNKAVNLLITDIDMLKNSGANGEEMASKGPNAASPMVKTFSLPASRRSLMQAWHHCRPSAHLWAAYLLTCVGKSLPSSAELNRYIGLSRWFEQFCTTFHPLRSRSVLVPADVVWHVPSDLGQMCIPSLLELDYSRATIVRSYSPFSDIKDPWKTPSIPTGRPGRSYPYR